MKIKELKEYCKKKSITGIEGLKKETNNRMY